MLWTMHVRLISTWKLPYAAEVKTVPCLGVGLKTLCVYLKSYLR